jgi:hypothetical protein
MKNLKSIKNYFRLGILILLSSCSSSSKLSEIKDKDGKVIAHHVSYDASRRGSLIFKNEKGDQIMLSEPPPDVATKLATDLGAKVNVTNQVEASLYMSTSKAIAELGKRTASVNMLRDALYKMSEMSMSKTLDSNSIGLFEKIIVSIESMHKAEMDASKVEQINAETEKVIAETEQFLAKGSFYDNEELGARKNYQIAIKFLIDKKLDDAKSYFKALYKKYPVHFRIDEINDKLENYDSSKMDDAKWKDIYKFLEENTYGIDKEIVKLLNKKNK